MDTKVLEKVKEQINDYLSMGFDTYGQKVAVSKNPLTDQPENSIFQGAIRNAAVTDEKISSLSVEKLNAGTISVAMNVGGGNVKIDGGNNRIVVNDGYTDRGIFGYLPGKF